MPSPPNGYSLIEVTLRPLLCLSHPAGEKIWTAPLTAPKAGEQNPRMSPKRHVLGVCNGPTVASHPHSLGLLSACLLSAWNRKQAILSARQWPKSCRTAMLLSLEVLPSVEKPAPSWTSSRGSSSTDAVACSETWFVTHSDRLGVPAHELMQR